ncbi:MAG: hypothetical protein ACM3ON_13090 [Chloroflexota bacterium]
MRKKRLMGCALALCIGVMALSGIALGEEKISIKGDVSHIDLEARTVLITTYDKQDITITIEDEKTMEKLRSGKIVVGDAVNVKYVVRNGKNVSTYFRKPAGC